MDGFCTKDWSGGWSARRQQQQPTVSKQGAEGQTAPAVTNQKIDDDGDIDDIDDDADDDADDDDDDVDYGDYDDNDDDDGWRSEHAAPGVTNQQFEQCGKQKRLLLQFYNLESMKAALGCLEGLQG